MDIETELRTSEIECRLQTIRQRNQERIRIGSDSDGFSIYDSSLNQYEEIFEGILYPDEIASICIKTTSRLGHCNILDICGQGSWITEIPKASGIAVALGFCQNKLQVPNTSLVTRIPGDILVPTTWRELQNYAPYDFILCSPQGESRFLWGEYPEILHDVIKNVLALMSNQATLLIEALFTIETCQKYIEGGFLDQLQNIKRKAYNGRIRIDKLPR